MIRSYEEQVSVDSIKFDSEVNLSVASLGFTSLITQIILLREFLSIFYGNELVIGIILANWMILTGIGSFLGRRVENIGNKPGFIIFSLVLIGILPSLTVFLLRWLRNIVFTAGGMADISQILYSSLILLLPYCLISGCLFTVFASNVSQKYQRNLISYIYSWEAIGSVIGGLVFNFVMIYFLRTFQSLLVLLCFDLGVGAFLSWRYSLRNMMYLIFLLLFITGVLNGFINFDELTKEYLFKDQHVFLYFDTPYGTLTITEQEGQKNFFENNVLLFSENDATLNEEAVHYAMLQHPRPREVLLVSGGLSGTTREILKYNVGRIDYVEINPWLVDVGKNYTSALNDPKIHIINEDARRYVRMTNQQYDVVLINVSDPGTAQLNRYFTVDFFRDLKRILSKNAVLSLSLLENVDYYGEDARIINSVMYNTLKSCFGNIAIIPGTTKNYFLSSDGALDINIARMVQQRGINNVFVNQYYIDDRILKERSADITKHLVSSSVVNEDFYPIAYYKQVLYWLSYFKFNYWTAGLILLIAVAVIARKMNAINFGMLTGGFAASSIEVILLISFQIIYGYIYLMTGLIITVFMAGLALGSLNRERVFRHAHVDNYIAVQFFVGIYAALLPFILLLMKNSMLSSIVVHSIFVILTFLISGVIGLQFSLASKLQTGRVSLVASGLYSVDLLGSAVGALIVTVYLIPLLGIVKVCFLIVMVSILGGVVSIIQRKNYLKPISQGRRLDDV